MEPTYQTIMEPTYHCDFCLKLFTIAELERCCMCHEIFCKQCVFFAHTIVEITANGEEVSYYCSDPCLQEDGRVSLDEVG
jgi:hypothetical protein